MKKKQNDMIHSKSLGMHSWIIIPDVILCLGADVQNHAVKHMVEQWAGLSWLCRVCWDAYLTVTLITTGMLVIISHCVQWVSALELSSQYFDVVRLGDKSAAAVFLDLS